MPVKNDARILLFIGAQRSVVIGIEQFQYFGVGHFSMVILECLHVYASRGIFIAQTRRELHLGMNHVGVAHISADETDDDGRRFRWAT